ncbi:carbon-nitrogen hydrolase family protein [Listeria innocua]|uniref:carbon-nitrogen hydrolase family protein n=1 Tax=Listeria innocua TaxID=1642 RepID=UPI0010F04B26|nr:carbon-nitrogen hydrolase family protein [Listeria innocua]EAD5705856.1 carbon-nitrogen hydrolase family protein [Listeria innocua]EAD5753559.1 carbon-nitrogen hydrolase family protein [Listeria innocua]EFO6643652.1 carbon-nitrogen hydrolase family protein [Listeria innocua]EHF3654348.1 carbon-nitrogen hydrolase family protein [Listeria innocua]EHF3672784.1 carbon-nitrogen hydrolase family protein [Listeria innocua]
MVTLKVALVQQQAVPNDKEANLNLSIQYIKAAHRKGADLVLFPEMWSNGYAPPFETAFDEPMDAGFEEERTRWLADAVARDSAYVTTLRKLAKELNIGVCTTYLSKTKQKPQNTAIIIDRNGEIILDYAKVHTCDFSLEALLQSGDEFNVCEFDGIKLGVMICYDREFPESARVLMLKGAEIILVPNACDMNPARLNQLNSRAFENMVGVAMANYPGEKWGRSTAFSPIVFDENEDYRDNTIIETDDVSEGIFIAEFNLDEIRSYRENETWGNAYRKPQTYTDLISLDVKEPFKRN